MTPLTCKRRAQLDARRRCGSERGERMRLGDTIIRGLGGVASSCARQEASSFMGSTNACSSSAAGPGPALLREDARLKRDPPPSAGPLIMEETAPTHLLTMGDRRFRTAALPAPRPCSLNSSSSCSSSCLTAVSASSAPVSSVGCSSFEIASSSTLGKCLSKSGETTCVDRVPRMATCLSLALGEIAVGVQRTRRAEQLTRSVAPLPRCLEQGVLEQQHLGFVDHIIDRVHKALGCGGELVHEDVEGLFDLGLDGALLLLLRVFVAPVVAAVVIVIVGRRHRRARHAAQDGLCSPGPAQGARGGALRRLIGSKRGVLEGGVVDCGAREVGAAQVCLDEDSAAGLGLGQVGVLEDGVIEGGVVDGGAREVGAIQVCLDEDSAARLGAGQVGATQVCFIEEGTARLGAGQVGGPGGVAQIVITDPGSVITIHVLAALGEHGQVGPMEACGPVLLGRLRLAHRALLGEKEALWEDG
eukprot:scaffold83807_cov57-Phaeocystis_antarctica.AAC.2